MANLSNEVRRIREQLRRGVVDLQAIDRLLAKVGERVDSEPRPTPRLNRINKYKGVVRKSLN